ncbi:MAG: type III pantothenate kinase [Hyphomicrobiales bacterium]
MRLIIDFGNTLKKVAIFKEKEIIFFNSYEKLDITELERIKELYPNITRSIISSVVSYPDSIKRYLEYHYSHLDFSNKTSVPFFNHYKNKETMGLDRIAAVCGGLSLFPDENVLVIDAGTCITFDILEKNKVYKGGAITLGIDMRFKALNTFTSKLPLLNSREEIGLIGDSTQSSIFSGVLNGVIAELDGIIEEYKSIYKDLKVVVSGGDYYYFDKRLKNNIFAIPNIVLKGLNVILDFNDQTQN